MNFAAVPGTIAEALRRAKVEGGAIEEITIRRQVLLNDSGPVQWEMSVRSPRESALAYADAQGKIRRLDLSQTTRAQTMDLTQGGEMLAEAVAQIREQFGTGPVFKSFSISTKTLGFKTRDPKDPAGEVGHYWDINGISKSTDIIPAHIRRKIGEGVRDEMLFRIEDVDWSRLPSLSPLPSKKPPCLAVGSRASMSIVQAPRVMPSRCAGNSPFAPAFSERALS